LVVEQGRDRVAAQRELLLFNKKRSTMFQWLTKQLWHNDFLEIVERHNAMDKQRHEKEARARLEYERLERERVRTSPFWARRESERKRDLLELELDDAEWILNYEKRLAQLQKKIAAQRSKAAQTGINTDRLRKLEHHLAGVRHSLD
jgi:hypothetical protein